MGFREDFMPETQFPTFSDSRKLGFRHQSFSETGLQVYGFLGNLSREEHIKRARVICP